MAILLLIIVGVILFIAFQIMVDRRNKAMGTDAGLEAMQNQLYDAIYKVSPNVAASVAPAKQATPQGQPKKGILQSVKDSFSSFMYGPRPMPADSQPSNAPTNATPTSPPEKTTGADVSDFFGGGSWFSGGWG